MGQTEVNVCISRLRICGSHKLDGRILFPDDNLAGLSQSALALLIIVIQLDGAERKPVHVVQQHQNNLRCIGAAAACYYYGKFFLTHIL